MRDRQCAGRRALSAPQSIYNEVPQIKSTYTSQQAMAEYKVSRDLVRALNSEDSGSAFFIKGPAPQGTAIMGGPAR